jgi:hypothetical protein
MFGPQYPYPMTPSLTMVSLPIDIKPVDKNHLFRTYST